MAKLLKGSILDSIDKEIFSVAYNEGNILLAYRMWCDHYFGWTPMEKQELMVSAGWNPKALWGNDIIYENLYTIKNLDILAAIRSGKTLGMGVKLLFLGWLFPGTEWMNSGPSVDQAATMFRILLPFVGMPKWEKFLSRIQRHPFPEFQLWNGSTFEFRGAGKEYIEQIRSREYDGVNVDEAGLFSSYAIQVFEGRILGSKAGRKRMGLFSLTTSKRAAARWLYERAKRGMPDNPNRVPDRLTIEMRTAENLYLDRNRLASISENMSDNLRKQELENEWVNIGQSLYPQDVLIGAFTQIGDTTGEVAKLEAAVGKSKGEKVFDDEWQEYSLPAEKGHYYVAGMDIGKGRRQKKSSIDDEMGQRGALTAAVLDVTTNPYKLVCFRYLEHTGHWGRSIELAKELKQKYPNIEIGWDSTGPGDVIDEVAVGQGLEVEFPVKFLGHIIKANMARGLAWSLEHGMIKGPYIKLLFNQLLYYVLDDDNLSQDGAIALMIAAHVAREREEGEGSGVIQKEDGQDWRQPNSREYARIELNPSDRGW